VRLPGQDEPDSTYEFTSRDLLQAMQANARELKRTTQLLTRRDRAALAAGDDPSPSPDSREEEEEAAPEAAVRVRLPDGCMLQGRFGAEEAASALHVFVAETLQEGAPAFDLKTTVGSTHRGVIDPSQGGTLNSMGLAPRGIVNLRWRDDGRHGKDVVRLDTPQQPLDPN